MSAPKYSEWLTVADVVTISKTSPKTIRRMIGRGQLKAYRFGRQLRIKPADLEKAMRPVTSLAAIVEMDAELAGDAA